MRATDEYTIKNEFHSSDQLMENAALAFVSAIEKENLNEQNILVLCGPGNNGGDGLAVCRILQERGYLVQALLVQFKEILSDDCALNFKRLKKVQILLKTSEIPDFSSSDILIDALLGSGLNGPTTGLVKQIIEAVNKSGKKVYSIDVPSGLSSVGISTGSGIIISDLVVSFQRPKSSFFYPENGQFIKNWICVPIGLSEEYIQEQDSYTFLLDGDIRHFLQPREKHAHKGTYGHALLLAGSHGKIGAAVLSARACLRSGVGLLTVYSPKCGYEILQISAPEAMCMSDTNNDILTDSPDLSSYTTIGIGPGIGADPLTITALQKTIETFRHPMVLDADAINGLAKHSELLKHLTPYSILTPHLKEFDRLVGESSNSMERIQKQLDFSQKHKCIVVLKGANTSISSPDGKLYFNTSGNPGMATGGSGDVLTGIITGLLAQKYEPLMAALIGVYFHGLAGDDAVLKNGQNALIASDIIEFLSIENLP